MDLSLIGLWPDQSIILNVERIERKRPILILSRENADSC
jgi:hypothetical protein